MEKTPPEEEEKETPSRKSSFTPDLFGYVPENIEKKDAEKWLVNYFYLNSQKLDSEYQRKNSRDKYFKRLGINAPMFPGDQNSSAKPLEPSSPKSEVKFQIIPRSDDEVRNSYLMKLKTNKILEDTPAKKHQTIIIFDWDDTLLCTSYITRQGAVELTPEEVEIISRLDDSAVMPLKCSFVGEKAYDLHFWSWLGFKK